MEKERKKEIDEELINTEKRILAGEIKTTSLAEFKELGISDISCRS